MESWENKILGDKLNDLQELPAGYGPNLSAKWDIVEAGLPANKKQRITPLLIRWAVAATVLLVVGLVWMNTGKEEAAGLLVKSPTIEPNKDFQPTQSSEKPPFSKDDHSSHPSPTSHPTNPKSKPAEELTHQAPPPTTTIPAHEDTNRGGINSNSQRDEKDSRSSNEETAIKPLLPTIDSTSGKIAEQNTLAALTAQKPQPAKKKTYQRDFDDGVLVLDTGFAPANRQHLSIRLLPFSSSKAGCEAPAPRLQLKQAL